MESGNSGYIVVRESEDWDVTSYCPNKKCNHYTISYEFSFCPHCGKEIIWWIENDSFEIEKESRDLLTEIRKNKSIALLNIRNENYAISDISTAILRGDSICYDTNIINGVYLSGN